MSPGGRCLWNKAYFEPHAHRSVGWCSRPWQTHRCPLSSRRCPASWGALLASPETRIRRNRQKQWVELRQYCREVEGGECQKQRIKSHAEHGHGRNQVAYTPPLGSRAKQTNEVQRLAKAVPGCIDLLHTDFTTQTLSKADFSIVSWKSNKSPVQGFPEAPLSAGAPGWLDHWPRGVQLKLRDHVPYAWDEPAEEEGSVALHEGGQGGEGGVEGQRHAENSLPPQLIGQAPQDEGPRHHSQVDYQPCQEGEGGGWREKTRRERPCSVLENPTPTFMHPRNSISPTWKVEYNGCSWQIRSSLQIQLLRNAIQKNSLTGLYICIYAIKGNHNWVWCFFLKCYSSGCIICRNRKCCDFIFK